MHPSIRAIALGLAVGAALATPARAQFQGGDISGIPFLQSVDFPPTPCLACPPTVCPWEPYTLTLRGEFPNGCYALKGVQILPPTVIPPVFEIQVERLTCERCTQAPVPWSIAVHLPALPPGNPTQLLQMRVRTVGCDSLILSDSTFYGHVPFHVPDSCRFVPPPLSDCFLVSWTQLEGRCDAFVSPEHPAEVMLKVGTSTPLAGLQGTIRLDPPGLRIARIDAVGHARGMRLTWTTGLGGQTARFVLFSQHGAPIPVTPGPLDGSPILKVTAVQAPGTTAPEVSYVTAYDLIAADSMAQGVEDCMIRMTPPDRFANFAARICSGASQCDFNHDGAADVRDLVGMVRCISGLALCIGLERFDCNGDGNVHLDDVLCCARYILSGGSRDSVGGRPEPEVRLSVGTPVRTGSGVDIPLRLRNAHRVGAAKLSLAYPDDRYEVTGVERVGGADNWLEVHALEDGRVVIGLIGLPSGEAPASEDVEYLVHMKLVSGHAPGGDVRIADGEFSGPDGARLAIEMMQSPVPLGDPSLALSPGRPNPFGRTTRFAVTLEHASQGEVAIYDLGGRLVTTLARGPLAAGTREYMWNGTDGDGRRAAAGLYFARVRAGSELRSQKLVLLGR